MTEVQENIMESTPVTVRVKPTYRKVASSKPVYYSILDSLGQMTANLLAFSSRPVTSDEGVKSGNES